MIPIQKHRLLSDEEFCECFDKALNYSEFYENLGYFSSKSIKPHVRNEIRSRMERLGLNDERIRAKKGNRKAPHQCLNCNAVTNNKYFCCPRCQKEYGKKQKIKAWKETGNTGCSVKTTLRNCIRDYILEKQNFKCSICGLECSWSNKPLNLILDHIDGDASNNKEENLRLICPNCDSQLDTYKSRNRNSARKFRK